jgi:hypothetical protein
VPLTELLTTKYRNWQVQRQHGSFNFVGFLYKLIGRRCLPWQNITPFQCDAVLVRNLLYSQYRYCFSGVGIEDILDVAGRRRAAHDDGGLWR